MFTEERCRHQVLAQQRPQAPQATELWDGTTHGYRAQMMPRTSDARRRAAGFGLCPAGSH